MKKYLFFLLATVQFFSVHSQSPTWQWATRVTLWTPYSNIITDPAGNVILSGRYMDSTRIGTILLTGERYNIYLAKYTPSGSLIWAQTIITSHGCMWDEIESDMYGNIYVAGQTNSNSSITIGSMVFTHNIPGSYSFIAKFTSNGLLSWAHCINNTISNAIVSMDLDLNDNLVVTGIMYGDSLKIGNAFVVGTNNNNSFTALFDANGILKWAKANNHLTSHFPLRVSIDPLLNTYVTFAEFGKSSYFLTKYDATGNLILNKDLGGHGGLGDCWRHRLQCDNQLNLYYTSDDTLCKIDGSGNHIWKKLIKTSLEDLSLDKNNNVYCTGYYHGGSLTIDNFTLTNPGYPATPSYSIQNMFVSKFDDNGVLQYLKGGNSAGTQRGQAVTVDNAGVVYVAGQTTNASIMLDNNYITSPYGNNYSCFVARLDDGNYTSLKENVNSERLKLFPNPAKDFVNLPGEYEGSQTTVRICNSLAQEVYFKKFDHSGSIQIDLKGLAIGIYFVEVISGKESGTEKLVID